MALARSLLFVPGNRRDLLDKAGNYAADGFILDLEDSVPNAEKPAARALLREVVGRFATRQLWVRVNPPDSDAGADDIRELAALDGLLGFVLPKIETVEAVQSVARMLEAAERSGPDNGRPLSLMLIIESALAVWRCFELATASTRVETIMFASARDGDLMTDLGCDWSGEGEALLHARAHVLLASRAARIAFPLDGVFAEVKDSAAFERDTQRSRSLGYRGRALIHPSQIEPANRIYRPTPAEVERSRRMLSAFDAAMERGHASTLFDGTMIDVAMANAARRVLEVAGETEAKDALA
jgi:citrate lyase subunit beta / citryl-CoA lyase